MKHKFSIKMILFFFFLFIFVGDLPWIAWSLGVNVCDVEDFEPIVKVVLVAWLSLFL